MKEALQQAEVWKWICGILVAIMITGLTAWFTFGNDVVSQQDLIHFSQPIIEAIERNTETLEKLSDTLDIMNDERHSDRELIISIDERLKSVERRVN